MKNKKLLSLMLAVIVLVAAATGAVMVLADTHTANEPSDDASPPQNNPGERQANEPLAPQPYYISVSGTVTDVSTTLWEGPGASGGSGLRIRLENAHGGTIYFNTTDGNTVFPFESEIDIGDVIIGFVQANMSMIDIYPPQYNPSVVIAGLPDDLNVRADRFNAWDNADFRFLSQDGMFAFTTDEDTVVITADGDAFNFAYGDLNGRRLVVVYGLSAQSIPELALAQKIIVLFEDPVSGPEPLPDDCGDVSTMPILVDGVELDAPPALMADDGVTVMVPLRAIAQALAFEVTWIPEDRAVELGLPAALEWNWALEDVTVMTATPPPGQVFSTTPIMRLAIGNEYVSYTYGMSGLMFTLPVSPVIVNGHTYVPLVSFFRDVLTLSNAFVFEGQIEIQSEGERTVTNVTTEHKSFCVK